MAQESNAPKIVIALLALATTSLIFMVLRFFCKGRYSKQFGWDDYTIGFSWFSLALYSGLVIASCEFGVGQHLGEIPKRELPIALQLLYIGRFFGIIAVQVSKTSFAITLLRLATKTWHRCIIWFIIVTLNIIMGLVALFLFVQCTPVQKAWLINTPGTCWDSRITISFSIFAGVYSSLIDFVLSLFPSVLIWNLQMNRKEKIGVIVAMSLGALAGIIAAIKTTYLTGTSRNNDFTFNSADLLIWSGAETAVTIIATSIPFLRLMFREVSKASRKEYISEHHMDKMSRARTQTTISTTYQGHGATARRFEDNSDLESQDGLGRKSSL